MLQMKHLVRIYQATLIRLTGIPITIPEAWDHILLPKAERFKTLPEMVLLVVQLIVTFQDSCLAVDHLILLHQALHPAQEP